MGIESFWYMVETSGKHFYYYGNEYIYKFGFAEEHSGFTIYKVYTTKGRLDFVIFDSDIVEIDMMNDFNIECRLLRNGKIEYKIEVRYNRTFL